MSERMDISEMKAEVLLNHLYPELAERWIVKNKGTFYRNYSEDVMRIDEEQGMVALSRDGFLRLLPQGLITTDDELKGKDFRSKYEELKSRKSRLEELFRPFDSWKFRNSLREEKQLSQLLGDKLDILLKTYFHIDRAEESNDYVREMMALLPMVSRLRGNFGKIGDLLSALLGYRVTTDLTRYDWSGWRQDAQPMVLYQVWIPDLKAHEYKTCNENLEALRTFIGEWFIPFDTRCVIEVKNDEPASLDNRLMLGYNTKLNS